MVSLCRSKMELIKNMREMVDADRNVDTYLLGRTAIDDAKLENHFRLTSAFSTKG